MKEFKSVSVKNFFSYGQQEQTLSLSGKDIWNINGENGKGKTTLCIEAMTFAIYGKHREDKIDECINRDVGKNCKVSLEFVGDDGATYKVIRYRKHDTHGNAVYLFKGNQDISCKNAKDTDEAIQSLIGMPYIAFINSTIFSSELYSNFLTAKNSERLVIFENILSLKEITYFYAEIKNILKELADSEETASLIMTEKKTTAELLSKQIEDYNSQAKTKLLSLKAQKEAAKAEIAKTAEELDKLKVLDVDKEKAKLSNNTLKAEYEKQLKEKEEALKSLNVKEPQEELEIVKKYCNFNFADNKAKEEKYKTDLETIRTRELGCEKINSEMASLRTSLGSLKTELNGYTSDKSKQEKDLESIKSAICPYCGQAMGVEETEEKKSKVLDKIEQLSNSISEIEKETTGMEIQLKDHADSYSELIADINRIKQSLNKDFIMNSDLEQEKFNNATKIVEDYKVKSEEANKKRETLNKEIDSLKLASENIETTEYTEDYLNNVADNIKEKEAYIREQETIVAGVDGSVKSAYDKSYVENMKNQLSVATQAAEEAKLAYDAVEDDIHHYEYLAECCSNKSGGFKKYFINEMIPVFNDDIARYLPFFFGDKKVEISFDKDLNETIKVDGKDVSFSSFSRGQKSRVEIAAAFALFDMSRVFFSNKSGLLVVDELLDNGLDEYGIKSAISVLNSFAQESKVFVVSHNPVVKECIDNVIEIKTDDGGFSYIV